MKLLHKSIRQLVGYAVLIFVICVPLFYLIIEQLYIQDVDDALYFKRDKLRQKAKFLQTPQNIDLWLHMDDDVRFMPSRSTQGKDTLYFAEHLDTLPNEMEPYRELISTIDIAQKPYTIIVRASLVESRDLIIGIAEAQAVLLSLLLAGWVLIVRFRSKRTWRPFYTTIDQLHQYELDGGHQLSYTPSDIREFNDLNTAIGSLIDRNQRTYASQKQFIENASHEMQTPLAIFRSKLDNMIEGKTLTPDESRDFQVLYEGVQRLHQLNKGLLLLSRIENKQFEDIETLSSLDFAQKSIAFLQDSIDDKQLRLSLRVDKDHSLRANQTLLQLMVTNLLGNAIRHNRPGGEIDVLIDDAGLHISNTGPALPFPEAELYTRFKKHASAQKGVGLGLAIIKEIADKYQYTLLYSYTEPEHRFSVLFLTTKPQN